MKKIFVIIACLATVLAPAIGAGETYPQSNNDFAFVLYGQLAGNTGGNIFFSPYSISSALAMTYNGAKGDTAKQMAQVLHFDSDIGRLNKEVQVIKGTLNGSGKSYELDIANALWCQKDYNFLEPFLEDMRTYYGAALNKVDFKNDTEGARNSINHWVSDKTKDKIPELIRSGMLDKLTRLVLTNAVYFKGSWSMPFKEQDTKESDFYITETKVVKTKLMFKGGEHFSYCEMEGVQAISLPYKGGELAMFIALPDKKLDIAIIEKKIAGGLFTRLVSGHRWWRKVEVYLPKFKSSSEFELKRMLSGMGMPDAFIAPNDLSIASADFSAMIGYKDLYISHVIHQAVVDVNEKGTEATAATAVVCGIGAAPQGKEPPSFLKRITRSYILYTIRERI